MKTRFSAETGDFGQVFCNGREIDDVTEVNVKEGFAIVQCRDEMGLLILKGDTIQTKRVEGQMQFVPYDLSA